ncbi:MAG: magnesium transporter CorA family protein [Acutalibacteraceae bacterium]
MISFYKSVDSCICETDAYEKGCWINVISPDRDEIKDLIEKYNVDETYIRSSLDEEESSHIEAEDGIAFLTFDVPSVEKEDDNLIYTTAPVGVVTTPDCVITISKNDNPVLMDFTQGVVKNIHTELKTQFVLSMLFRMATRFSQYLKQIDRYSGNIESKLRKSMKNKELTQLLDLEKSLVYFQTSLNANNVMIKKLMRGKYLKLYEEDEDLLDDVLIEMAQAIEMCGIYSSILSGTLDAFASIISNNLNMVMKILTSITIVMAIPTMVFSFYGMNTGVNAGGLPLASFWLWPTLVALGATLIVTIILYKMKMF